MSDTMLELVTNAIRDADIVQHAKRHPELGVGAIRKAADECIDDYIVCARAAIEAMRDPTVDMLVSSGTIEGWNEAARRHADECHLEWWSSMIDCALQPATDSEATK